MNREIALRKLNALVQGAALARSRFARAASVAWSAGERGRNSAAALGRVACAHLRRDVVTVRDVQ